jgi:thiol-disulfide isomerase/thioredoxin
MRRFRAFGLVLMALFSLRTPVAVAADLPTAEAVLKIHRENRARFSRVHLQLVQSYETTDAQCRRAQKDADEKERILKLLKAAGPSDRTLKVDGKPVEGAEAARIMEYLSGAEAQQTIKHLRAQSKPFRLIDPMEFFQDGDQYQFRMPVIRPKTDAELQAWTFCAAPVTAESLLADYRDIGIYSRSAKTKPAARWWHHSADRAAYITDKPLSELMNVHLPPYTDITKPGWGERHPYDGFFSQPAEKYRVVREEEIDHQLLTVVDVQLPLSPTSESRLVYRGWLDLKRGAIPIKLYQLQGHADTPQDVFERSQPYEITTTHSMCELPGGAFYPTKTVAEYWNTDPDAPELTKEEWQKVREGKRRVPVVVDRRYTWDCSFVDNQPQFTEDFFVLPFPEDQQLYDHDAHKMVGELERQPLVKVGQPAPPLTISHWGDGKPRTLADLKGQVVVLDFWGLWCGPCRASIPKLKAIQAQFPDKPVTFIAIHNAEKDPKDLAARIAEFQQKNDWRFVAAIDSGRMIEDSVTGRAYGIKGFPTTVIIGADGKIVYVDPDLEGPECDDPDPEKLAAFEKEANALMESRFEAVGETWPIDPDLDEKKQTEIYERAERRFIALQIETALENAPR